MLCVARFSRGRVVMASLEAAQICDGRHMEPSGTLTRPNRFARTLLTPGSPSSQPLPSTNDLAMSALRCDFGSQRRQKRWNPPDALSPLPRGLCCRPHLSASTPVKRPLLLLMTTRGSTFPSVCISKPLPYPEEATLYAAVISACTCEILPDQLLTPRLWPGYTCWKHRTSPQKRHGPIAT